MKIVKKYGITIVLTIAILSTFAISVFATTYYSSTYGFNYPAPNTLDTTFDAENVGQNLEYAGYDNYYREDWSVATAYTYMPSDSVFYFAGHGRPGRVTFYNGSSYSFLYADGSVNLSYAKNINGSSSFSVGKI